MKILVGMSGGVDSTYAVLKLLEDGHTVEGAVLRMHCYTEVDAAIESAKSLGVPIHTLDCEEAFQEKVQSNFISEYHLGRTPNPCVICNNEVKFRVLLDYALKSGFDAISTGHYARIVKLFDNDGVHYTLGRAKDSKKDQTYMLWRLPQDILSHLILPLSECEKSNVKNEVRKNELTSADRGESQEICFVPDGDYAKFIEDRSYPSKKGYYINNEGKILGEHNGIIRYTVGQRKGLGIALGERVFVTKIDPVNNTVMLSSREILENVVYISGMNFLGISEPEAGAAFNLSVKLRYLAPPVKCTVEYLGEGKGRVALESPVRAITPGQSAVFYDDDVLIMGGFIDFSECK
jgi:tRNA-specific 2-thiouridylase